MWLLIVGGFIYVAWKLKPRHAVKELLELEWIRALQAQHQLEPLTLEKYNRRFSRKLVVSSVMLFAFTWTAVTVAFWNMSVSLMVAPALTVMYAAAVVKLTRHTRCVVVPMYLTLCTLRGGSWNSHDRPQKWLSVPRNSAGNVTVRLPQDWHANSTTIGLVADLVKTRMPGDWEVVTDKRRFRMVFTPRVVAEVAPLDVTPAVTTDSNVITVDWDSDEDGDW